MVKNPFFLTLVLAFSLVQAGCAGYTQKSLLADNFKSIHVAPVQNAIDLGGEITDKKPFRVYRPGVEVEITNAIINRYIFDGNLKISSPEKADLVLEAKLTDYRRDAVRYSEGDDVQEYRLSVTLDATLKDVRTQKVLWQSGALVGDTSFFLSGPRALSEDVAVQTAIDDAARRVVDKTIEVW